MCLECQCGNKIPFFVLFMSLFDVCYRYTSVKAFARYGVLINTQILWIMQKDGGGLSAILYYFIVKQTVDDCYPFTLNDALL